MLTIGKNTILLTVVSIVQGCSADKFNTYQYLKGYKVEEENGLTIVTESYNMKGKICLLHCLSRADCRSVSANNLNMCKLHSVSPYEMGFMGQITNENTWRLFYTETVKLWLPIAKFSSSNGVFMGDYSWEVWTNPSSSMNNDVCASENVSVSCNRHYVHKHKDWLLGLEHVTKVKVSLYEDAVEAAWVIFEKQPGSDDNWFQPSRVIDSYPWDTDLLKSTAEMSLEPQEYTNTVRFYIVKSNSFHLRAWSPYKYWMKIFEADISQVGLVNQCEYGTVPAPYILYSKDSNPTLLSRSGVSHVVKWSAPSGGGWNTISQTEAPAFCQTHLGVPIATYDEVDTVRANRPYQCCRFGWMANNTAAAPMNEVVGSCTSHVGTTTTGTNSNSKFPVYCKPDHDLVGIADTMVISINV